MSIESKYYQVVKITGHGNQEEWYKNEEIVRNGLTIEEAEKFKMMYCRDYDDDSVFSTDRTVIRYEIREMK